VDDTVAIQQMSHQISTLIHRAMVFVQQHQMDFLVEKYRFLDWDQPQRKAGFIRAASLEISKGLEERSPDLLMQRIEKILRAVFVAEFFKLKLFKSLMERIEQITSSCAVLANDEPANDEPANDGLANGRLTDERQAHGRQAHERQAEGRQGQSSRAIAILLLDVENIRLSIEEERFLQSSCDYSIRIKIAFANWRAMGRHDAEFHGRGYQLIHVPLGKNSADMKMTAIGSSIFVHYPNAEAVFICSSDKDLTHLKNTLQAHGLTVYSVRKRAQMLVVRNSVTGRTETYSIDAIREVPTIAQTVIRLKEIIQTEQEATGDPWVKLSRISSLFASAYGITLSDVTRIQSGKRIKDIFLDNSRLFRVHQFTERGEVHVCLFVPPVAGIKPAPTPEPVDTPKVLTTITSAEHLEEVLLSILEDLIAQSEKPAISISEVHTYFQIDYGQTIKEVLQTLNIKQRYITFLESCSAFELTQTEKGWLMSPAKI